MPLIPGRYRCICMSSRPAWSTNGESIPHQLGFKGVFILGGKTYIHTNRQERSLVSGAGAGNKRQNQEANPRLAALLLKRNIPRPSGLVFQQLLADGAEVTPCCTVGSYFSDYWLRQRKLLPQHLPLLFK